MVYFLGLFPVLVGFFETLIFYLQYLYISGLAAMMGDRSSEAALQHFNFFNFFCNHLNSYMYWACYGFILFSGFLLKVGSYIRMFGFNIGYKRPLISARPGV